MKIQKFTRWITALGLTCTLIVTTTQALSQQGASCWIAVDEMKANTQCSCTAPSGRCPDWRFQYIEWKECRVTEGTGKSECNSDMYGLRGWRFRCKEDVNFLNALACFGATVGGAVTAGGVCGGSFSLGCVPALVAYFGGVVQVCNRCKVYDCAQDDENKEMLRGEVFLDFGQNEICEGEVQP